MTGTGAGAPRWRLVRAGTDAVPARVRRFFAAGGGRDRPGRPGRRWLAPGGVVLLVGLLGWLALATPLLGVREVRVTGVAILTPDQVRQQAAITDRMPLLRVDTGEVADRVAGLAPVARAQVRRDWPSTLVIEVVERTAVAAVPAGDGFELLDGSGVVFHTVPTAPAALPEVVVAAPGPADPATRAALTVLAALTGELRSDLATLTVSGPATITLVLSTGTTVRWGDEHDSAEKARVATALLADSALPNLDQTVIDVSSPEVVSVR